MTEKGRQDAVQEELQLAAEELRAAAHLLRQGLARISLTRAYFAVFHAIRARLYAEGLEPRTHAGTQHLFNAHFVKTGLYEPSTSRLVARLQKFREEADYSQAFVVDEEGAREELAAADRLVEQIRRDLG